MTVEAIDGVLSGGCRIVFRCEAEPHWARSLSAVVWLWFGRRLAPFVIPAFTTIAVAGLVLVIVRPPRRRDLESITSPENLDGLGLAIREPIARPVCMNRTPHRPSGIAVAVDEDPVLAPSTQPAGVHSTPSARGACWR